MNAPTSQTREAEAARTEPDSTPASVGSGPAAKLATWDEALAHAEALRAGSVKVEIDVGWKTIEIRGTNGRLQDPDDGTPALQAFYRDGAPKRISHYIEGELQDPAGDIPAWQEFYLDGTPKVVEHWTNGKRHDPDDGTPAYQEFYPDGTPIWIGHYTDGEKHDPADSTPAWLAFRAGGSLERACHYTKGRFVNEKMFPLPTGEV